MIPYSRQRIDDEDVAAVSQVLRGAWLTTGPAVAEFEAALCEATGARHAVAVNSGTAALHIALLAAKIGVGDSVATTTISFSASANAASYVGADLRLVDIHPDTWNLDGAAVPDVDAVIAVDFTGRPFDVSSLANRPRVVIRDAAQSLGGATASARVGKCDDVDMTTFSFHAVKSITTAEGGAVTTNDAELAARLRRFRSHGIDHSLTQDSWSYDIVELGWNYRLPDVLAALGASQLRKLERFVAERTRIVNRYREMLADDPRIELPPPLDARIRSAHHLFPVLVDDRERVFDHLRRAGIGVQVHHVPIHRLAIHRHLGDPADFPVAERYYARTLSLPVFPGLSRGDQDRVIEVLRGAVSEA